MRKIVFLFLLLSCSSWGQYAKEYYVQSGETIDIIAAQNKVTKKDLIALNPNIDLPLQVSNRILIPKSIYDSQEEQEVKVLKKFTKHKVRRKETLYSISKKYNISQEEIIKHNPHLQTEALRKRERLKIPIFKVEKQLRLKNSIKTYTVKPKEGKWRIAYQFGLTLPELESLNPQIKPILHAGDHINVPNLEPRDQKEINDQKYIYYTVQKAEGFYALKRKFGLTQDEIEALNPGVSESGLKLGSVIKLPKKSHIDPDIGTIEKIDLSSYSNNSVNQEIKLGLLMPFGFHKLNSKDKAATQEILQNNRMLKLAVDFYSGVEMALDSAKTLGISSYLKIIDTQGTNEELKRELNSHSLDSFDALVGPIQKNQLEITAQHLRKIKKPLFAPFTKIKSTNKILFNTLPFESQFEKSMIGFIDKQKKDWKIAIISDHKNRAKSNRLKKAFPNATQFFSQKNEKGKDAYFVYLANLEKYFKDNKFIVFLETANAGMVENVSSLLNGLQNEKCEIVLATTSKNKAFERAGYGNLSGLKFHYPSTNKEIHTEKQRNFISKFKNKYGIHPNKYALRGFDLTLDIVLRLASGTQLMEDTELIETEYLENKFRYKKMPNGGFINQAIYILKYDKLDIIPAL